MPQPNAIASQGTSRPGPTSTAIHARTRSATRRAKFERPSGHANAGRRPAATLVRPRAARLRPGRALCPARPSRGPQCPRYNLRHATGAACTAHPVRAVHSQPAARIEPDRAPASVRWATVGAAPSLEAGSFSCGLHGAGSVLTTLPGLHLCPRVAQAHRAIVDQPPRRRIRVTEEIALPLELHRPLGICAGQSGLEPAIRQHFE
jgi:hypothetical protein